jgi:type II secretory pathway pseudopilin PulG
MKLRVTHQAAFTMMEIAIAIGVIAFALIAIIGVLPSGMQVQRDNREETLIQQDATYLLEAMRGTAQDIPDLHTFVVSSNGVPDPFTNSLDLVRALMSRDNGAGSTNLYVFRAITGPTVMRAQGVPTFRYMVRSLVTGSAVETNDAVRFIISTNTYDVRLTFLWPVLPNGELADPAQKLVMRTVISGSWDGGNRFTSSDFP